MTKQVDNALEKLDAICDRLIKQRGPGIQLLAYLKDISDNEARWAKYGESFAGNVINLNIVSAENSLILLCTRVWDKKKDAHSIPNAIENLHSCQGEILERRMSDHGEEFRHRLSKRFTDSVNEIFEKFEVVSKSPVQPALRVLRTENLAHLLADSRDRAKHFPAGFENHGITRNDLFDFATASIRMVEDIGSVCNGESYNFDDSFEVFQSYCRSFWEAVPVFRDVEKLT